MSVFADSRHRMLGVYKYTMSVKRSSGSDRDDNDLFGTADPAVEVGIVLHYRLFARPRVDFQLMRNAESALLGVPQLQPATWGVGRFKTERLSSGRS
jgi:hypothetical protein